MKVYIRPLPAYFSAADLRHLLGMYGLVESARVVNERPGDKADRCAIVEMARPAEARKVCALLDGKEFRGNELRVSTSEPLVQAAVLH